MMSREEQMDLIFISNEFNKRVLEVIEEMKRRSQVCDFYLVNEDLGEDWIDKRYYKDEIKEFENALENKKLGFWDKDVFTLWSDVNYIILTCDHMGIEFFPMMDFY